jgi:hypothetical protein
MYISIVLIAIGGQPIPAPRPAGGGSPRAAEKPDLAGWLPVDKDFIPSSYRGRIIGLVGKTVTIKPEGDLKIGQIKTLPGGAVEKRLYVQDNTGPPRTFAFHGMLLRFSGLDSTYRGGVTPPHDTDHKVGDLQIGDVVDIGCERLEGVDYCHRVSIQRRPGGLVPPANGDAKLPAAKQWCTHCNALQAAEGKALLILRDLGVWHFR